MNKNIFYNLNNKQYLAVTYPLKSVLILAGAGSGKTHVLINRIVWLIKFKNVLFSQILAVTFTNKAANEIILRLSKIFLNFSNINNNIWIGTFHSICNKLLRIHYKKVNLPYYFRIIDFNDQLSLIGSLIKELKLDKNIYSKKKIIYIFNKFKDKGIRYINLKKKMYDTNIILLYKLYEKQCEINGVVDFSELLLRVYEFFLKEKKILKKYKKIFKYIFIDEFQDTNLLQYKLLKLLGNKKNVIFAVGDDDQNIFTFRGSNINNMLLFKKDFNILKIIKLEQNYRSYKYILNAANYIISNNKNRLEKKLFTNLNLGEKIVIFESYNEFQEVQWVIKKIKKICKKNKINNNIAILYRLNFQSRLLENNFFLEKIPYKIYGKYNFLKKKEIQKAIFYLKLINNIHDNLSFLEVVNFPPRGIGLKTLKKLKFLSNNYNCSLYSSVFYIENKKRKSSLALINFIKLINMICNKIKQLSFKKSIIFILESSGIIYFYKNFKKKIFSLDNLNQLINLTNYFLLNYFNYFIKNKKNIINILLSNFLSYILIENENYYFNDKKKKKIQLMTIHSSKGLEFDVIFIIGLEEGIFPSYKGDYKKKSFIEEERRLMYVAITRAKKKLYISFNNCRTFLGNKIYNKKSRFINELPNFLVKKISYKNIK
ncbi:ATP-dependent helicase [Candidatus Zinderia endosymbiont of Aphrophora alni]|uniref:ATP-dependent helicase n=1 Tax=Candidatus Zinderia endosymbiont of Aphrophora alni TaxID=3077951 RepID=UPI0030D498BC